jgi:hypothetical protein
MERLQRVYPDRFPDVQLRTLQRRVREWRHVMARSLVHGLRDGSGTEQEPTVVGASAAGSTRENATRPGLPGARTPDRYEPDRSP